MCLLTAGSDFCFFFHNLSTKPSDDLTVGAYGMSFILKAYISSEVAFIFKMSDFPLKSKTEKQNIKLLYSNLKALSFNHKLW